MFLVSRKISATRRFSLRTVTGRSRLPRLRSKEETGVEESEKGTRVSRSKWWVRGTTRVSPGNAGERRRRRAL